MRKMGLFLGAIGAAILMISGFTAQVCAADPKDEITELEHKCAAATTVDQLMECYDKSNDLVVYDLMTPREFDGRDAVKADFQNAFNSFKNAKVEFINLHVVSDGKLGVAESVQHMTATGNDGKPVDVIFRVTDVWRKEKGGWKIIHAHISVPVDMASGKADMQSK